MYRCEARFELEPIIKLSVNYYVGDKPIHTFVLVKSRRQEQKEYPCVTCNIIPPTSKTQYDANNYWDMWGTSSYTEKNLTKLIKVMKNNINDDEYPILSGLTWKNNTFKYILGHNQMVYNEFKLHNNERLQFIEEFTYLNQIFLVIYNKMRMLDDMHTLDHMVIK